MKSLASLALILAAPAVAQEPPPGAGPRGSSQPQPGEQRLDTVGRANVGEGTVVPGLAADAFVEITALDSGKTVVTTTGPGGAGGTTLSREAAAKLGLPDGGTVRVRRAVVSPPEASDLRQGATLSRIDAPPALLAGLRKRLPQVATPAKPSVVPTEPAPAIARPQPVSAKPKPVPTVAKPAPAPAPQRRGYWVQIASLSNEANARALAAKLGGSVSPVGKLYRVRIGPLADHAAADRAHARAVAQGYRDASITKPD